MTEKINLQDLIDLLVQQSKMEQTDIETFVRAFWETVEEGLLHDGIVKVKGLGTFKLVDVESRESINVNTGERFEIQQHMKITFMADSSMRNIINKPFAHFESVILNENTSFDDIEENVVGEVVPEMGEEPDREEKNLMESPITNTEKQGEEENAESSSTYVQKENQPVLSLVVEEDKTEVMDVPMDKAVTLDTQMTDNCGDKDVSENTEEKEILEDRSVPDDTGETEDQEHLESAIPEVVEQVEEMEMCSDDEKEGDINDCDESTLSDESENPGEEEHNLREAPCVIDVQEDEGEKSQSEVVHVQNTVADNRSEKSLCVETKGTRRVITRNTLPVLIIVVVLIIVGGIYFLSLYKFGHQKESPIYNQNQTGQKSVALSVDSGSLEDKTADVNDVTTEPNVVEYVSKGKTSPEQKKETVVEPKGEKRPVLVTHVKGKETVADTLEYEMVGVMSSETVRSGDTLAKYAFKYYGNRKLWQYIAAYNKSVVKDPNNVPIGTTLKIPVLKLRKQKVD